MKETKKILCHFSFYDQVRIQEKLEEMAEQGWMIQQPGNFTWTFKRIEPQKLRFSVTYFPNASDFDPGPTESELTKLDFCAQDGWKLAVRWGVMQIFYNEDENAVPIETEPVAQVENVKKSMRKNVLFSHLMIVALIMYYMVMQFGMFRRDPVEYLSSPLKAYQIPMWVCLLLASLYELGFYFYWTRKAKKMAEEDGVFLPIKSNIRASYVLLAFSTMLILFAFSSSMKHFLFGLAWSGIMFLIACAANVVKKKLKKKGVSRRINMVVSLGSVFLLTIFALGILVSVIIGSSIIRLSGSENAVGTYEYNGITWDIYNDPLPLTVEDLIEIDGNWSKEMDHQETGLVSYTEYEQCALYTEPREVPNLSYTITNIKAKFLRDYIRQAVLNSRQDEVYDDYVFTDHYEPIDPDIWGAEEAYQLHWSGSIMNTYLLFWDNSIVEIKFYWEPTAAQITKAAEVLRQS
ncbi:MAG: DUF2812 domain-containing protein [Bacteroidaceae bacterium]|nr:DUF2812 domain-containing protein [Bacteroidaceae bacterium]